MSRNTRQSCTEESHHEQMICQLSCFSSGLSVTVTKWQTPKVGLRVKFGILNSDRYLPCFQAPLGEIAELMNWSGEKKFADWGLTYHNHCGFSLDFVSTRRRHLYTMPFPHSRWEESIYCNVTSCV